MRAVWLVRSHQIARKLAWWLALIGYDRNDHSWSHRIYLVYASIFWSIWFLAVFSLFSGPAFSLLAILGVTPVSRAAVSLLILALLGWGLFQLWGASYCSPFIFSESDAHLICQSPVPGSAVALSWLLGDWFERAAPFWAGAVIFSFALVENSLNYDVGIRDLPAYLAAGFRIVVVVSLLHAGLMALVWSVGAFRLQRDRQLTWQPAGVRVLVLIVAAGLLYTLAQQGVVGLYRHVWGWGLWPLEFSLGAAYGADSWFSGLAVSLVWFGLGLTSLAFTGINLNLSRAAQETVQKEKIETAHRYGQGELAQQITLANRLQGGHPPSRLPAWPGWRMLAWKDVLQSIRSLTLGDLWGWLLFFLTGTGICYAPDLGSRGLALVFWAVIIGQRSTRRFQKDLAAWSLFRQLPFSNRELVMADLALPWALIVLLSWLTLALAGGGWVAAYRLPAAVVVLFMTASIAAAAAFDLLRQSRSDLLLNGTFPQISSIGGLLGILCLVLPLGLWFVLERYHINGSLPAAALALVLAWGFGYLASRQMQKIE